MIAVFSEYCFSTRYEVGHGGCAAYKSQLSSVTHEECHNACKAESWCKSYWYQLYGSDPKKCNLVEGSCLFD